MMLDAVVIGAGAAGLAATAELGRRHRRVLVLEARDRIGGRVWSIKRSGSRTLERGAEFIHGGSPALRTLLRRAGLRQRKLDPPLWWRDRHGLRAAPDFWRRVRRAIDCLPGKDRGWSLAHALREAPAKLAPEERRLLRFYVEGFNGAPAAAISAGSLRTMHAGADTTDYKIEGPYGAALAALRRTWPAGVSLQLRAAVSLIEWRPGRVIVHANQGGRRHRYAAHAAIVTVPLGVLRSGRPRFRPALRKKETAWRRLGWGEVVRLNLRFRRGFWDAPFLPRGLRGGRGRAFGFVHAPGEAVPTWWALSPPAPTLVGWAGGPATRRLPRHRLLRTVALDSLARILGTTSAILRAWLVDFDHHDWSRDPWTRGAYSFPVAGREKERQTASTPVAGVLFFAGEATAEDYGTVHGALDSGVRAARELQRFTSRA